MWPADAAFKRDADGRRVRLGRGSFGTMYAATYCGEDVVVEEVRGVEVEGLRGVVGASALVAACLRELEVLASLRHRHVVTVYGGYTDGSYVCVVMERSAGTLAKALGGASAGQRLQWLLQVRARGRVVRDAARAALSPARGRALAQRRHAAAVHAHARCRCRPRCASATPRA